MWVGLPHHPVPLLQIPLGPFRPRQAYLNTNYPPITLARLRCRGRETSLDSCTLDTAESGGDGAAAVALCNRAQAVGVRCYPGGLPFWGFLTLVLCLYVGPLVCLRHSTGCEI